MDGPGIALRLLVYLQGALLLGTLLFAAPWTLQIRRAAMGIALAGVALNGIAVVALAASLSESGTLLDWPTIQLLLGETATGWAAIVRILALTGVIVAIAATGLHPLASGLSIIAVASLAWNGHGGMTEGLAGWLHLGADALHLIAGLGWIGAVAAFLWTASRSRECSSELSGRLERFASTGSILVALLLVTGVANTLFIVGWEGVVGLTTTTYGRLLLLKILLFAGMLSAAAANRFWLTPRLETSSSLVAIRASLAAELIVGGVVLGLVAWLGTLDPAQ
jgi:copper resistance protein D